MPRYLLPQRHLGSTLALATALLCGLGSALGCAGPNPGSTGARSDMASEARLRARWLEARDWGSAETGGHVLPDMDVLTLGGPREATLHLAFGPIPPRPAVVRATVTLFVHADSAGPAESTRIVVHESGPFRGGSLTGRHRPSAMGAPAGLATLQRPQRRLTVDITALAHARQRAGGGSLFLLVRATGRGSATFWSPRGAVLRERPRLTLFFR